MDRQIPSLSALKAFEAAARLGSFKLAAEQLNLSTSAISHQVRGLEEFLGKSLFERQNNGVALTQSGSTYLKTVRAALDQLERGTLAMKGRIAGAAVKISLLSTLSTLWLIPKLDQFRRLHKQTRIELVDDPSIVDFNSSSLDAAIRYDFSGQQSWPNLVVHPLLEEYLFPVCSPEYLQQFPEIVELAWDSHHTLLLNSRHTDEWQKWIGSHNLSADLITKPSQTTLDTSSMTLMAAKNGLGIALARTPFIDQFLVESSLVRIHHFSQNRGIRHYLVYPPEHANNPDLIRFRDWLVRLARDCNRDYQNSIRSALPQG